MASRIVRIPVELTSDYYNLIYLNQSFIEAISLAKYTDTIEFDFSNTSWIDAEMTVLLSMMFELALNTVSTVTVNLENMPDKVKTILQKNNFFPSYGLGVPIFDTFKTTIPFFSEQPTEDSKIHEYIKEKVFTAIGTKISTEFLKEISYCIFEIVHNVRDHSDSDRFYICGQHYPKTGKLRLAISDLGIGVPSRVRNRNPNIKSDIDAVDWAFIDGNSTKRRNEGGLGLYSIKDLLHQRGQLKLISNQAYYEILQAGISKATEMPNRFRGTLLWIEFDINKCLKPRKNVRIDSNDTFNF